MGYNLRQGLVGGDVFQNSKISRRHFLNKTASMTAGFYLLPYGLGLSATQALGATEQSTFFDAEEYKVLSSLCDQIFPKATTFGAVRYIETLLTAFDTNPPKIYAGGPYSGRASYSKNGSVTNQFPENSFAQYLPLNRIQETTWRLKIYGSRSMPGGWWNQKMDGHVTGLRDIVKEGLKAATDNGNEIPGWGNTSIEFQKSVKPLIVEACFCAPEYGGNQGLEGWKLSHFTGDNQPLGYSFYNETTQKYQEHPNFPVSTYDNQDVQKMSLFTRTLCSLIARFHGGRIYR